MCDSDLQKRHSGDGCLPSSILFKYERGRGYSFVLSWAKVRRVALGSVVSVSCTVSSMMVLMYFMLV